MKKYYGYFVYNDEEYVIRFKIDGSLRWSEKERCFIDDHWYTRSIAEVICMAALDSHPINVKAFGSAFLITHQYFIKQRSRGVKRWNPKREIIIWQR